jgi:hypothetical protein
MPRGNLLDKLGLNERLVVLGVLGLLGMYYLVSTELRTHAEEEVEEDLLDN